MSVRSRIVSAITSVRVPRLNCSALVTTSLLVDGPLGAPATKLGGVPTPEPFEVQVPQGDVDDLRARLRRTRWPEAEAVDDWSQGIPLSYVQELCAWWADDYDMGLATRVNA